jgi:predicted RNase H-like HicB family nuclease
MRSPPETRVGFSRWWISFAAGSVVYLRSSLEDIVEVSVLIQQTAGNGFRAWCAEPVAATAEGATREEAIAKLRVALEAKTRDIEVVRLTLSPRPAATPIWPDDEITRDWLAGIAAARQADDRSTDPWDEVPTEQP